MITKLKLIFTLAVGLGAAMFFGWALIWIAMHLDLQTARRWFYAVETWVDAEPERDNSVFIRQAAREKLQRDGIQFDERVPAETV